MSSIGWRRTVGAVALVTVAGLASACGGDSGSDSGSEAVSDELGEKIVEQAIEDSDEDVDVDIDGEDFTIDSDEGTFKFGSGELPESFPEELTVVEGEITSSVDTPDGSLFTLDVADAKAAFDAAVADLEANGWIRELVSDTGETFVASYSTDEQTATISADTVAGEITYIVGVKA